MFETFPKINTNHVSGAVTGNIKSSSKGQTGKETVTQEVEVDFDEISYSDFAKASVRVFYEIYHGKSGVLP